MTIQTLANSAAAETRSMILPVRGMTCAACSARLERVLAKVDGVTQTNVSLAGERAEVHFDPMRTSVRDIAKAITKAGFSVPVATIEIGVEGMTCAACSTRLEKVLNKVPGSGDSDGQSRR